MHPAPSSKIPFQTCLSARMAPHISCISSEDHKGSNPVVHYFACVEIQARHQYFKSLPESDGDKEKIRDELRRISKLRQFVAYDAHYGDEPHDRDPARGAPATQGTQSIQDGHDAPDAEHELSRGYLDKCLVCCVARSHEKWKEQVGPEALGVVRKHRPTNHKCLGTGEECNHDFNPTEESFGGCPLRNTPKKKINPQERTEPSSLDQDSPQRLAYEPKRDTRAYLIEYTRDLKGSYQPAQYEEADLSSTDQQTAVWKGKFPDRKAIVYDLLDRPSIEGGPNYLHDNSAPAGGTQTTAGSTDALHPTARNQPRMPNLRYFHFPANNMKWVEDAVSQYYDESLASPLRKRARTDMLLRHRFWTGQLHGGHQSFIHARHLRPLCEIVSSDPGTVEATPNNIALFTFAKIIDQAIGKHNKDVEDEEKKAATERRARLREMYAKLGNTGTQKDDATPTNPTNQQEPRATIDTFPAAVVARLQKYMYGLKHSGTYPERVNGRLIFTKPLAQLLYDASRLMEEIENYRDKKMIQCYLYPDSKDRPSLSLHPRRTLDQAYYCSLKNTSSRDRDQVVYRGTTSKEDSWHTWKREPEGKESGRVQGRVVWACRDNQTIGIEKRRERLADVNILDSYARKYTKIKRRCPNCMSAIPHKRAKGKQACPKDDDVTDPSDVDSEQEGCPFCGSVGWGCGCSKVNVNIKDPDDPERVIYSFPPEDPDKGTDSPCRVCRDNIRKLSRVVMVDQLWMWILDEHTILTFFPRRYGYNRQDLTGIHKTIRTRLADATDNQIMSVFDLALIILSACAKPFFDRTRTFDMQPRVLDLFSEAIGRVSHKQMIAFSRVWESAEKLRRLSSAPSPAELSSIHVPLLNITPEGKLQREIKDILDELGIMIHLVEQQKAVLDKFVKNASTIICGNKSGIRKEKGDRAWNKKANKSFTVSAQEVLCDVENFHLELLSLKASAKSTSDELDHLLSLKQQQASVIQAWQSITIGEEAVKQGRAIIIFTTMTIIFLPLAFLAAVFGMNNPEFEPRAEIPISLGKQLGIMFGVSAVLIILVLTLAFSAMVRAFFSSAYERVTTRVLVRTGIYRLWARWSPTWSSTSQLKRTKAAVKRAKAREARAAQRQFVREMDEMLALKEERQKRRNAAEERKNRNNAQGIGGNCTAGMNGGNGNTGLSSSTTDIRRQSEGFGCGLFGRSCKKDQSHV
ncbi:hypothetical protein DL768_002893 [Monosporascus sp. mg162]|nr:hypothetical protein DL768_002893 [Monosporascus sp. mg162]